MTENKLAAAQCVILAGGKGERMRPFIDDMPKPMFPIGGKPILWHIMKCFQYYGVDRFVLCLGYKGDRIREYFETEAEDWSIDFLDTGENTIKGERLRAAEAVLGGNDFYLAYGDDLSDVDIAELTRAHREMGTLVTLTAVPLVSNFGVIDMNGDNVVQRFEEKPTLDYWINGGFFCMQKGIFEYLEAGMDLEDDLLPALAGRQEIAAFKHDGFWSPLNTKKDTQRILKIWEAGHAPWRKWD